MQGAGELHGDVGGVVGAEVILGFECGGGGDVDGEIFGGAKKGRD